MGKENRGGGRGMRVQCKGFGDEDILWEGGEETDIKERNQRNDQGEVEAGRRVQLNLRNKVKKNHQVCKELKRKRSEKERAH